MTDENDETREFVETYLRLGQLEHVEAEDLDEYLKAFSPARFYRDYLKEIQDLSEARERRRRERSMLNEVGPLIQNALADALLTRHIEKHFPNANWEDKSFLNGEIRTILNEGNVFDVVSPSDELRQHAKDGLGKARRRWRINRIGRYWKRTVRH